MPQDIHISDKELNYLEDLDFLLTRHSINQKMNQLLLATEDKLKQYIRLQKVEFPEGTKHKAGKIARGENYQLLPYLLLDYPRLFHKQSIFAFRTMFWWGHYFSVTLHLSGAALDKLRPVLLANADQLDTENLFFYINRTDPWQHHLSEENYAATRSLSLEYLRTKISEMPYIKVASQLELKQWQKLPEFTLGFFKQMLSVLSLHTVDSVE
ncbi:hypothetical protein PZB74_21715 [Porifericola rhodea]|uniref:hypothetical protein n=1 Tax=Porifericola rhodea TaxID=930972 RepID=UPI002666C4C9|nr:hypothetical protein [Porifericola rhodea]WKN31568.1 hypothetical protein PZB74_21715 [Porifericola rhodea]